MNRLLKKERGKSHGAAKVDSPDNADSQSLGGCSSEESLAAPDNVMLHPAQNGSRKLLDTTNAISDTPSTKETENDKSNGYDKTKCRFGGVDSKSNIIEMPDTMNGKEVSGASVWSNKISDFERCISDTKGASLESVKSVPSVPTTIPQDRPSVETPCESPPHINLKYASERKLPETDAPSEKASERTSENTEVGRKGSDIAGLELPDFPRVLRTKTADLSEADLAIENAAIEHDNTTRHAYFLS